VRDDPLIGLIAVFVPFSLAAVGGTLSVLAGIQHEAVDVRHWLTGREFIEIFAVSRGAPGPGSMLVTLIGWKVAGWLGAVVATLALYLPSALLMLVVAKIWGRYRGRSWHSAVQNGLAPVGVGLILAGIVAVFRIAGAGPLSWAVAIGSAIILGWRPRMHPLLLLAAGGLVFIAHWKATGT
jgi:chromate transporter